MEYQDNESIGYLTATVSQALADSMSRHFRESGIDLPFSQFIVLMQLYLRDGQTQQEISTTLRKDKAAIKRTVDNLVQRGLVARQVVKGSTKNIPLLLTERANVLRDEIRDLYARHFGRVISNVSQEQIDVTKETLRQILANLQSRPE